jgi:hypothetical protein
MGYLLKIFITKNVIKKAKTQKSVSSNFKNTFIVTL